MGARADEVVAPHMVRPRRPEPHTRSIVEPQPPARFLLLWNFQPLTTPDSLDPVLAHSPACALQQCGDAAIAITPVLLSKFSNSLGQLIFVFPLGRSVALRAAWLIHQPARMTLRHATSLLRMDHRPATSFRA